MRGPGKHLPVMSLHRGSGQARVVIRGRDHYLGPWGSPEAQERYDALIATYLAHGRTAVEGLVPVTVAELGDLYVDHARGYYVKAGKPTSTAAHIELTLELLYRAGLGELALASFRPSHLQSFQRWLACEPSGRWSRTTINKRVGFVRAMFRWAVAQEYAHESVWRSLQAVPDLRKGRPVPGAKRPPREPRTIGPADPAAIAAVCARLPAMISAMVRVQLLTAMRPAALCALRPMHLHRTNEKDVFAYVVPDEAYKLGHVEGDEGATGRRVFIGPKAWAILAPLIDGLEPDAYVFSPSRSEAARSAARAAARKTKVYGRRRRAPWPSRAAGERYEPTAYRRAITRACELAGVPRWTPYQLRHAAASEIAEHSKLEVAQAMLGHRNIKTTLGYVKVRDQRATAAAKRHG